MGASNQRPLDTFWKETEMSINVAESINQILNVKAEIDMDYNEDENYKSNKLVMPPEDGQILWAIK